MLQQSGHFLSKNVGVANGGATREGQGVWPMMMRQILRASLGSKSENLTQNADLLPSEAPQNLLR